jgi:hypothetical protein
MQNTTHNVDQSTAQPDVFADIFARLGVPEIPDGAVPDAPAQRAPVSASRRSVPALPRSATAAPSIDAISGEIRRLTRENTGIIGSLKTKLLGDPVRRQQLATLATRVNGLNYSEEVSLALFLLAAIRLSMFEAVSNSVDAMYRHVAQFDPESPAQEVGWKLIELNKGYLIDLAHEVSQRGEERMLRAVDLDR